MAPNNKADLKLWLPTTKKEMEIRGWEYVDVIIFTGDAYVDHPSFGAAVIGRTLESEGLRVAIVPQPNWRDDLRDFKKLGKPRLFFSVSAGAMDSMVNHYTANKRLRSDDAYTPDGKAGMRPDYPTIVYSNILKDLFPDTPVIIGGIEASMRRLAHYDYWQDSFRKSILIDSKADILVYGMGEKPVKAIARELANGKNVSELKDIPQTAVLCATDVAKNDDKNITLHSYEVCLKDKRKDAENFKIIDEESNRVTDITLWQKYNDCAVKVNPPFEPMTEEEIDASFDLPYTRLPHPKYAGKSLSAYEMIKFSVNLHRGCFGGCAFCAIAAHQGKHITSRSERSVLEEIKKLTLMPDFKGYLSDLGGPSANMYGLGGKDKELCLRCKRPTCLHPAICKNLDTNHHPLIELYKEVDKLPKVKKATIGSGIRYDLFLTNEDPSGKLGYDEYFEQLMKRHVSGRLKVAPEHSSDEVLRLMRKPSFNLFVKLKKKFDKVNEKYRLNQQLIPYFISSHPACTLTDMAELAVKTKELGYKLEQVQDFTPTPMTLATEIYYSGYDPYSLKPIFVAKTKQEKLDQQRFFFWYKPENRQYVKNALRKIGKALWIDKLFRG